MAEYIKKFANPAAADQYAINDIPFITSVDGDPIQNLHCNLSGKKLVNTGGIISVQSAGPVIPNNEIWYTTPGGDTDMYDLAFIIDMLVSQGATYNGPAVISNKYDDELQMWRMIFDDDVTVLGDVNRETMTIEGPFFVTNSELGLSCNIETIILSESVKRIGDYTFAGCTSLSSVTIPNSVKSIGYLAFFDCNSLRSVTIPNSVTTIGDYAFDDCDGLASVNIGNNVTNIGGGAFIHCASLTSITIPDSVRSIGDGAFWYCRGGDYIDGCYYLGNDVFVQSFREDINDIVIREGTKYVEAESIGCYQTISFPSTTKIIGSYAIFRNGGGSGDLDLISVTCHAVTPPVINYNEIGHIDDTTVFYVPAQSVNAYKTAPGWSTYADRIQAIQ